MTVIVIFGAAVHPGGQPSATLRARVDAAFACGGPDADYLPTGAVGRHPPSEASVMARLLVAHGVSPARIRLEEASTNTLSSAVNCARMLGGRPGPVRVASSGYHLPRCLLLMRLAGVRATRCPPPPSLGPWFSVWYWRLRECAALPVDAVLMLPRRLAWRR